MDADLIALAAKDAEIAQLRSADELLRVGIRRLELDSIVKDQQIAALRERCERLREMALSQDDYRRSIETHHLYSRVGSTQLNLMRASHDDLTRSRNAYLSANAACNAHNDLQPPAGKESSDGHS